MVFWSCSFGALNRGECTKKDWEGSLKFSSDEKEEGGQKGNASVVKMQTQHKTRANTVSFDS